MANILEFLRGVLTESDAQETFRADPGGYIDEAGFVDLTGEDVVEAVLVLRRSLPDDLAARLTAFEDDDALPSVRPGPEETELDAAVRMLNFAIDEAGDMTGVGATTTPAADRGPIDVENELDTDLAAPAAKPAAAKPAAGPFTPAPAGPPLAGAAGEALNRFSTALDALVVDASTAIEQAAAHARASLRDTIAAAEVDADALRAQGEEDRAAARTDADRIRTEADDTLQRAREQSEESRRRAEELVAEAQAESEATRAELAARRQELREVERQLKERLSDIDSLFRSLGDDETPEATR
jgi:hypothetical protein